MSAHKKDMSSLINMCGRQPAPKAYETNLKELGF
jgi:hypothetical protein